jgi:Protein DA1
MTALSRARSGAGGFAVALSVAVLVWLAATPRLRGEAAGRVCHVCEEAWKGKAYVFRDLEHGGEKIICEACRQLPDSCSGCGIPVKPGAKSFSDGRKLCREDAVVALVDEAQAQQAFQETLGQAARAFAGFEPIPFHNVTFHLAQEMPSPPPGTGEGTERGWIHLGLTRSRKSGAAISHEIHVVAGLTPGRFAAVVAHEFAHAWVFQHLPPKRKIHPDTVEAFCELVAYRMMEEKSAEFQKLTIRSNLYTKGQIHTLIKVANELQFHRLVEWMRSGTDAAIEVDEQGRVAALRMAQPLPLYYPVVPRERVASLKLKAVSFGKTRRWAMINDVGFEENESARVRLLDRTVRVTCLEIRRNSVSIRVDDDPTPVDLVYGQ